MTAVKETELKGTVKGKTLPEGWDKTKHFVEYAERKFRRKSYGDNGPQFQTAYRAMMDEGEEVQGWEDKDATEQVVALFADINSEKIYSALKGINEKAKELELAAKRENAGDIIAAFNGEKAEMLPEYFDTWEAAKLALADIEDLIAIERTEVMERTGAVNKMEVVLTSTGFWLGEHAFEKETDRTEVPRDFTPTEYTYTTTPKKVGKKVTYKAKRVGDVNKQGIGTDAYTMTAKVEGNAKTYKGKGDSLLMAQKDAGTKLYKALGIKAPKGWGNTPDNFKVVKL